MIMMMINVIIIITILSLLPFIFYFYQWCWGREMLHFLLYVLDQMSVLFFSILHFQCNCKFGC